jgi:hypothetical protein
MQKSEFEEKTVEQHITFELLGKKALFLPPGQVLENTLGVDAALFTRNLHFWRLFKHKSNLIQWWKNGILVDPNWWSNLDSSIEYFPDFKLNLFVQYKRPLYLDYYTSGEWHYWEKPYYRYKIEAHQQIALEKLGGKIKDDGIVVYASPAFHTYKQFWKILKKSSFIKNTNFSEIEKLKGHSKFTYSKSGNFGVAFSEPEEIESSDFLTKINSILENEEYEGNNTEFIHKIDRITQEIIESTEEYTDIYYTMVRDRTEDIESDIGRSIIRINTFCFLYNIRWMIGFGNNDNLRTAQRMH